MWERKEDYIYTSCVCVFRGGEGGFGGEVRESIGIYVMWEPECVRAECVAARRGQPTTLRTD